MTEQKSETGKRSAVKRLVSCPFCGEDERLKIISIDVIGPHAYVVCEKCYCHGPQMKKNGDAKLHWDIRSREHNLEIALALLLEASAPYLSRKKMTPRPDHKFLKEAYFVAEKLLCS